MSRAGNKISHILKWMMRTTMLAKIILLCIAALFIAGSVMAVEVSIGPADMSLQTEAAKKPATFPHRDHQEMFACTACHHVKDEVMIIDKCAGCHTKDISIADVNSYKKAAHKLCKGCHKGVNKEGKAAPIKCSGCHPRKE
jgi:predicted CXXCH cytochrome family protein